MEKAKELEKKYEWLQATDYYEKAVDLALKKKKSSIATELHEKIGFLKIRKRGEHEALLLL